MVVVCAGRGVGRCYTTDQGGVTGSQQREGEENSGKHP